MKRKTAALAAALAAMTLCLAGCGGGNAPASSEPETQPETEALAESAAQPEEAPAPAETETGDTAQASDTAVLVVSFGTSYNDSRDITIGAVENAIAKAHPEYEVRRAFTAQIIIDKLKERDGLEIDNVTEALDRAVADGVQNLIVQPTHLMDGLEYMDLMAELGDYP